MGPWDLVQTSKLGLDTHKDALPCIFPAILDRIQAEDPPGGAGTVGQKHKQGRVFRDNGGENRESGNKIFNLRC